MIGMKTDEPGIVETPVPTQDITDNTYISQVIGNKNDSVIGTSLYSEAKRIDSNLHSSSKVYPPLADAITISKVNISSWGVDTTTTTVISANAITSTFNIYAVCVGAISDADQYELIIYSGAVSSEIEIARIPFDKRAYLLETIAEVHSPIQSANARISAKLSAKGAAARSIDIKLCYQLYL